MYETQDEIIKRLAAELEETRFWMSELLKVPLIRKDLIRRKVIEEKKEE